MYLDEETDTWKLDGIQLVEETGVTVDQIAVYCFKTQHTTMFGVFE